MTVRISKIDWYNTWIKIIAKVNAELPRVMNEIFRTPIQRKTDKVLISKLENQRKKDFTNSKSQLGQDLLALVVNNDSKSSSKTFFEFGATDGLTLSNTYLLEREYGWTGLLAEPAKEWQRELHRNRKCLIDQRCVWKKSGERLQFSELGELSGLISHLTAKDRHGDYEVETISVNDLLEFWNMPNQIGFLSIDTEGSEYEILQEVNFSRYKFNVIVCEHNYTRNRKRIKKLLSSVGYQRVLTGMSFWDDWYIRSEIVRSVRG